MVSILMRMTSVTRRQPDAADPLGYPATAWPGCARPFIHLFRPPMAATRSAGLLVYRRRNGSIEVFLVHPGGPFWRNKDDGAWSVPKGEYTHDEEALAAAQREFLEETGMSVSGTFTPLAPVRQAGGKLV